MESLDRAELNGESEAAGSDGLRELDALELAVVAGGYGENPMDGGR